MREKVNDTEWEVGDREIILCVAVHNIQIQVQCIFPCFVWFGS